MGEGLIENGLLAHWPLHVFPETLLLMDTQLARAHSLALTDVLGYPRPPAHFPVHSGGPVHNEQEVVERALVLNIVINCAFQMPIPLARSWLRQEGLEGVLTPGEQHYLGEVEKGLAPESQGHQLQVEALWALVWALALVPVLDFGKHCGDELSGLLPDLRQSEGSRSFRKRAHLRRPEELYQALDLAYCLSWGIAEANLTRSPVPGRVEQYVVWERRRALEWLHGDDWDKPRTDT